MRPFLSSMLLALAMLGLVASSAPAMTSDSFRCPNGALVRVGDKLTAVMAKCDRPTSAKQYYESYDREEWVYNLGPTSFVTYFTFTNGTLTRIELGDYGY